MIRTPKKDFFLRGRYQLLLVVFLVLGLITVSRLFYLQILKGHYYEERAHRQHSIEQVLLQRRGEVFIHDDLGGKLAPLIINKKLNLVYAVPKEIKQPALTAKILANIFLDPTGSCKELLDKGSSDKLIKRCQARKELEKKFFQQLSKEHDPYEPLKHKVDEKTMNAIKKLSLKGIYFKDELVRFYPEAEKASQITGFLGFKSRHRVGQYGIEEYYEDELAGEAGKILGDKDIAGNLIPVEETKLIKAQDGENIILTIDRTIQDKAYEIIEQAVKDYGAENGVLIVMDPYNAKIKAMVGYPSFDANNYSKVNSLEEYENLAMTQAYEPGSIFKVITMAAGLDSGAVEVDSSYVDEGFIKFGRFKIRNAENKKYGKINMTEILEKSVNTGAVHIAMLTGKERFRNYVKAFGFGQRWQIGLSGESPGDISALDKRGEIYLATASYGQGITVTPLQMAVAMVAIVNNGQLIKPTLVEQVGNKKIDNSHFRQQVISKKTAEILKAMLVSVIKNGHGKLAQVQGYYLGGKTGTAEISSKSGGYAKQGTNHSFIGFGPLDNPKFVIMVKLSKPKWGKFSAVTAAPTFQKMAKFLLQYYQIPPTNREN